MHAAGTVPSEQLDPLMVMESLAHDVDVDVAPCFAT
jgi:hypothetical protein